MLGCPLVIEKDSLGNRPKQHKVIKNTVGFNLFQVLGFNPVELVEPFLESISALLHKGCITFFCLINLIKTVLKVQTIGIKLSYKQEQILCEVKKNLTILLQHTSLNLKISPCVLRC